MNKEFDFNKVGKKMPYKIPGTFLEGFSVNSVSKIKKEKRGRHIRMHLWKISFAAASVVLILITGIFLKKGSEAPVINFNDTIKNATISESTEVERIIRELSDDELTLISLMLDSDMFNE
ncbi:MAG: hypothetical protein A2X18_01545 [Bacteroidetes bacterium GWF2_40_14]|nr:MAG: hypothetical protein A2X18_01545 [Bacteroidetes bacterium GWF2_40_14]